MKMEPFEVKIGIFENLFQQFCLSLQNPTHRNVFTIDYLNTVEAQGDINQNISIHNFCQALLQETLHYMKNLSSHENIDELCQKIKCAAFLLSLVSVDNDFCDMYESFHQVEVEVLNLKWNDNRIKTFLCKKVAENLSFPPTSAGNENSEINFYISK
eukprot:TRINITY_DN20586_c0_g1_i1.p1 TRINITY_DN20586_c0_g1~~TRINITY_DN20586_c0_g1_i1.p1  ORF type:complete len:157 (+),score=18.33 TRINITY_DN20586_c0_g1_i1:92-562(+)